MEKVEVLVLSVEEKGPTLYVGPVGLDITWLTLRDYCQAGFCESDDSTTFYIKTVTTTKDEIDALPEFDGF